MRLPQLRAGIPAQAGFQMFRPEMPQVRAHNDCEIALEERIEHEKIFNVSGVTCPGIFSCVFQFLFSREQIRKTSNSRRRSFITGRAFRVLHLPRT